MYFFLLYLLAHLGQTPPKKIPIKNNFTTSQIYHSTLASPKGAQFLKSFPQTSFSVSNTLLTTSKKMLSKPGSGKLPDKKIKFSDTSPNLIIYSLPNDTYNNNIAVLITAGMQFFFILHCLLRTYSLLSKRKFQKALNSENDNICNFISTPHPQSPQMLSLSYFESILLPQSSIYSMNIVKGKTIYETFYLGPNQLYLSTSAFHPSYIPEINHTELTTSSPVLIISAHTPSKLSYYHPYRTRKQTYNFMRTSNHADHPPETISPPAQYQPGPSDPPQHKHE